MTDTNQLRKTGRWIAGLRRWLSPLLVAYESRLSGRMFAAGMVVGAIFAFVTSTPPYIPLICLIVWPLTLAMICGIYLVIGVLEFRFWRALGLGAALALNLLFVVSMTGGLILVTFPDWPLLPP